MSNLSRLGGNESWINMRHLGQSGDTILDQSRSLDHWTILPDLLTWMFERIGESHDGGTSFALNKRSGVGLRMRKDGWFGQVGREGSAWGGDFTEVVSLRTGESGVDLNLRSRSGGEGISSFHGEVGVVREKVM